MKQKAVWKSFYLVPFFLAVCLTFFYVQTHHTQAAINPLINFQGKLTNPDGTNLTNGSYSIVFSIYTVASGGSNVWTETKSVTVTDGIFQTSLGDTTALPGSVDFNTGTLYLGIKVGTDAEMTPRVMLTAAPYAFNSDKVGGLVSGNFVQMAQGLQVDSSTANASIAINKTGGTAKIVDLQRGGVAVFSVNNDGSDLFKTQADSATAFDIQDTAGVSLFTIDSLTDRIYVGDSVADGVGVLLVLDNKNTVGDPSGVFGGMYYNSNTSMYRCFRGVSAVVADGAWEPCGTQAIDRSYSQEEEFFNGGTTTGTIGKLGWAAATITTAPAYTYNNAGAPAVTADRPGILRLRTAATANTGGTLSLGTASMAVGTGEVVKASIATAAVGVSTQVVRIGIHNETTTVTRPTTGVWWEYDPSLSLNWQYCYVNATPATVCAASATAPVANTFTTLEIRVTGMGVGTSSAEFLVNGTKSTVSGITINATNLGSPAITCYAVVTATARDCFVDYYQIRGGSGTLR